MDAKELEKFLKSSISSRVPVRFLPISMINQQPVFNKPVASREFNNDYATIIDEMVTSGIPRHFVFNWVAKRMRSDGATHLEIPRRLCHRFQGISANDSILHKAKDFEGDSEKQLTSDTCIDKDPNARKGSPDITVPLSESVEDSLANTTNTSAGNTTLTRDAITQSAMLPQRDFAEKLSTEISNLALLSANNCCLAGNNIMPGVMIQDDVTGDTLPQCKPVTGDTLPQWKPATDISNYCRYDGDNTAKKEKGTMEYLAESPTHKNLSRQLAVPALAVCDHSLSEESGAGMRKGADETILHEYERNFTRYIDGKTLGKCGDGRK